MTKKNPTPEEREQIVALLREIRRDVRDLIEHLQARRGK
jgi:hypothetical protein